MPLTKIGEQMLTRKEKKQLLQNLSMDTPENRAYKLSGLFGSKVGALGYLGKRVYEDKYKHKPFYSARSIGVYRDR